MYLCYIDESGTSSIPGNTSHYVLAGLSIPIWDWKQSDRSINELRQKHSLSEAEIHTAWMLRKYLEQDRIPGFEAMSYQKRHVAVEQKRNAELLRLQRSNNTKHYRQTKKSYSKTADYIHLTYDERVAFIAEIATCVSGWGSARLFAECIDKIHFGAGKRRKSVDEQAFEQVVSRFEQFLENSGDGSEKRYGLLIHDNNQTVAARHTELMQRFHVAGTLWTKVENIMETPLFVDSALTSMVQIADLCSYAIRRYLENGESKLFDMVFA